jgi:peptidoglycan hydrolase-like protein with peptidoglycan-binding domain
MSLTTAGVQRAIMPSAWGSPVYRFDPKDTTTPHYTIFTNDAGMVIDLVDDVTEQTNRWYGTGITPKGVRIRNIRYPGLMKAKAAPYPIAGGTSFSLGTTDADTINGDGITVLQIKLQQMSYYGWGNPITGVFDETTAEAVIRLKADVNLTVNGTMTVKAWNRLWDIDATGFSINGAKRFPLLADPRTEKFLYSASGAVIGLNPDFDAKVLPREREIDFGPNVTKQQMIDWCRGDQARSAGKNLSGTITLTDFGVWAGQWNGSDAATLNRDDSTGYPGRPDLIVPLTDVRPGRNAWLPLVDGGTLVHIAGVQLRRNGTSVTATLTVDTQARDFLELAALKKRNRDARRDIRREWYAANRSSKPSGNMTPRDEFFGRLHQVEHVTGGAWHVYPMPAGQSGMINRVHIQTYDAETPFAMVIIAEAHSEEQLERELERRIPNPLAAVPDGTPPWWEQDKNKKWFRDRTLLYAAGTHEQPCGYWPGKHTDAKGDTTTAPVTGEWIYDNPFPYLTGEFAPGVVWMGFWAPADTKIKPGQQLWAQEDDVN